MFIGHYGKEFIVGMTDHERVLYIASEQNGVYTISVPDSNLLETGHLAQGITEIHFNKNIYLENKKGLHIVTNVLESILISDEGLARPYGPFLALPSNIMGTFYMVPGFQKHTRGLLVVAVEDKAFIAVTGSVNRTETVVLSNILDTFTSVEYEDEITNTLIVANKPVSISVEFSRVNGDSMSDILVEQMLPYDVWTNEYIIPPLPSITRLTARIMSTENQTVCINHKQNETCFDINWVSGMNIFVQSKPFTIKSNASIGVILSGTHTCNQSEYGQEVHQIMIILPGINNYLNRYSFVIPDFKTTDNYVVVLIHSLKVSGLILDGTPFAFNASFNVTTSKGDFKVIIASTSVGYHIMHHLDSGVRFGALAYGIDKINCSSTKYQSYGFALGYSFEKKRKYRIIFFV